MGSEEKEIATGYGNAGKVLHAGHKLVTHREGQMILLSTTNLRVKGIPTKLQRKFVGPFWVVEYIGTQTYRLVLPSHWRIHPVFHVSRLKSWKEVMFTRGPNFR